MDKIPVGATIARTYGFVFGRFFALLGIVWLSWAVIAVGALLLRSQTMALSAAATTHSFSGVGLALLVLIPFYLVMLVLVLMQYMGFTELALGQRQGSPYFYFKLGQPLWLLVLSFVLLILIFIAIGLPMAMGIGLLSGALVAAGGKLAGGLAGAILGLILPCGFIYFVVRLSFLLAPIVVAEKHIGLKRAWTLGKGNFWRMFVIILAVALPILVIGGIAMFSVMFKGMPPPPTAGADPAQMAQYRAAVAAWQAAMMGRMLGYWYITYPAYIAFTVLFYGLSAAAQAFAYRALVPEDIADTFS